MAGMNVERSIYNHLVDVMEQLEKANEKLKQNEAQKSKEKKKWKRKQQEKIKKLKRTYQELINALNTAHRRELAESKKESRYWQEKCHTQEKMIQKLEEAYRLLQETVTKQDSNVHNNSTNSSLPPSTDQRPSKGKAANMHNSRTKSGRKSGGQKGHPGKTVKLQQAKQLLTEKGIRPQVKEFGKPGPVWKERLVLDIPVGVQAKLLRFYADEQGKVAIPREYENEVSYGQNLKSLVVYLYGQGVQSLQRTTELIKGLTKGVIHISEGTVCKWLERFHNAAETVKATIEKHLLVQHQVNTDGTVVTLDGKQSYIRNFSVKEWVLYVSMGSKGHKALSEIPFLKSFAGVLMHDHETSLYRYGLQHAECNVHLLRYLRKNTEDTQHSWSRKLAALLAGMNSYVKELKEQGAAQVPQETLKRLEDRYDAILDLAARERKEHRCRFNWASREEQALLNRLKKYKAQHLLFLRDFAVSFDNNMSERDLRKCKNRQKMSGGFRTERGKEVFCSVLSVIETCKRQALDIFAAIKKVFAHEPLFV